MVLKIDKNWWGKKGKLWKWKMGIQWAVWDWIFLKTFILFSLLFYLGNCNWKPKEWVGYLVYILVRTYLVSGWLLVTIYIVYVRLWVYLVNEFGWGYIALFIFHDFMFRILLFYLLKNKFKKKTFKIWLV